MSNFTKGKRSLAQCQVEYTTKILCQNIQMRFWIQFCYKIQSRNLTNEGVNHMYSNCPTMFQINQIKYVVTDYMNLWIWMLLRAWDWAFVLAMFRISDVILQARIFFSPKTTIISCTMSDKQRLSSWYFEIRRIKYLGDWFNAKQ